MTSFPVPQAALTPDPEAQWWQRPNQRAEWRPVDAAAIAALPAGVALCRGGEPRLRNRKAALGCWCRMPSEQGPGRWVDQAEAKAAWARGDALWWPGAPGWVQAPTAVEVVDLQSAAAMEVVEAKVPAAPVEVQPVVAAPWPRGPLPRSEYTINGHTFEMVRVPPGTFMMGSPPEEPDRHPDEAQVQVTLTRAFEVGVFPVTQAFWQAVMGENPSNHQTGMDAPRRPVETIDWFQAVRFCNAASMAHGLTEAYTKRRREGWCYNPDGPGFRLPTEAEWEYAARAGEAYRYAGGDDPDAVAWHAVNSARSTQPVGGKRPNAWGLHDMSGNVREWCFDRWIDRYGGGVDPLGKAASDTRVSRGSSYRSRPQDVRVAFRHYCTPPNRSSDLGLRLVRTVP
jgi:formylglycine-generating enzyme required for sulfatase activity